MLQPLYLYTEGWFVPIASLDMVPKKEIPTPGRTEFQLLHRLQPIIVMNELFQLTINSNV
jgi:hypothetical protein